jgi:hypothetical protein
MKPDQAKKWLSGPRFQNFLNATDGDHDEAVALYLWNAEASAAFLGTLHHVEVLLRNAIDRRFPRTDPECSVSVCRPAEVWLVNPAVLTDPGREKVNDAICRLTNESRRPTRSRLVASLTFGFWAALFAGTYEDLWRSTLRHAFPHGNGKRNQVRKALTRTQQLRNQIAHHEAIFGRNLTKDHGVILGIAGFIDPEAKDYIGDQSAVDGVLASRPDQEA